MSQYQDKKLISRSQNINQSTFNMSQSINRSGNSQLISRSIGNSQSN